MAISTSLRYYRQQFNPEAAYATQAADNGIISMYNPEQQAQFIDAVAQRQQRYDASTAAIMAEKARIGEMETYDLPELTKRLNAFEGNINDVVKNKYNGDYGAAANEIAKMIGTERTNPFYHFNKQKVEMSKAYLDTKMKLGSNFMSAENPLNVSFNDWQNGATFDFTPVNRQDIVKDAAAEFGSIAETIMNDPTLQNTPDGRFIMSTIQTGIKDPTQLQQFLKSEAGQTMITNLMERNPNLTKLNPDEVMGAINEGAYSAIGKTQVNFMQNPDYIDAYQRAQIGAKGGNTGFNLITPTGAINTGKLFKSTNAVKSYSVNTLSPDRMNTQDLNEQEKVLSNLNNVVKSFVVTPTPGEFVQYIGHSKKNIENFNSKEPISITDVTLSPKGENPSIILGIQGVDADGKALEAVVSLDAMHPKTQMMLPYILRLTQPDDDPNSFYNNFATWANDSFKANKK